MATWESIGSEKRSQRDAKIPQEWHLPESTLKQVSMHANLNVLDIPSTCGILSEKEVALTERYDATELLALLAKGEVRYVLIVADVGECSR
jgi:amidase